MNYRLAEMDCAQARMQVSVGVSAIQAIWLYERPVDLEQLERFRESLQHGRLGRVIAPASIAAAGDRWTTNAHFAPLDVDAHPIARTDLDTWIAERGDAEVIVYGGPAWRLAVTAIDDGGSAVSLLVSHAIADGLSVTSAIVEAQSGTRLDWSFESDGWSRLKLLATDASASARHIRRVAKLYAGARRSFAAATTAEQGADVPAAPAGPTPPPVPTLPSGFRIPRATATISSEHWHPAAAARGGSGTTLGVAIAAELAAQIGRVDADGTAHIAMPFSTRTGVDDRRANAVRGLRLAVPTAGLSEDLQPLKQQMKTELTNATSTANPEELAMATFTALPRFWIARTAWSSVPADHSTTVCSVRLGAEPELSNIDGAPAASMSFGLVNRGIEDPSRLARFGGCLGIAMVEVGGLVSVRVSSFHAETVRSSDELKAVMATVFGRYGLEATFC